MAEVADRPPSSAAWITRIGPGPLDPPAPEPDKGGTNGAPANPSGTNGNDKPVAPSPSATPPAAPVAQPGAGTAQPKPPLPKPAAAPAANSNDDDIDKEEVPKSQVDWDRLKTKYKGRTADMLKQLSDREKAVQENQAKIAELEKKLGERPAQDPAIEAKIKHLEGLVEKQMEAIMMSDIENEPRFKSYYTDKLSSIVEAAKGLVGEDKASQMESLMKLPEGDYKTAQIRTFLDEIDDEWVRDDIRAEVRKYRDLSAEKEAERKKWNEHGKTIKAKNEETQKARFEQVRQMLTKSFDDEISKLQDPKDGSFMWQKHEGPEYEAWNKSVDQRVEAAKKLMLSNNEKASTMSQTVLNAVAYPVLLAAYLEDRKTWDADRTKLEAQVKALSAAQPGAGSGSGAPAGEPSTSARPGMNPHQRSAAWAADMAKAMTAAQGS